MHPRKARFVSLCQQLLVLSVVGAALVPAARMVDLDVVPGSDAPATPSGSAAHGGRPATGGALAAYTKAALTPSRVPTAPVRPTVHQIELTSTPAALAGGVAPRLVGRVTAPVTTAARVATRVAGSRTAHVVTSTPQPVTGYGVVGVTWSHGDDLPHKDVAIALRTEKDEVWTGWKKLEYDDDGPDPDSAEGRHDRPGSIEGLVGHVDQVQVRMTVTGVDVPPGLQLSVIDPGTPAKTKEELPALDTARIDPDPASAPDTLEPPVQGQVGGIKLAAATTATTSGTGETSGTAGVQAVLDAAAVTPKPQIYSRAQWGANESLRDKPSLHYYEIHGGFVHHTVNANDYTRAEVPGIIRSIYAYHVQSRGWSDIGYNFLIDRFGRIWEGRYGGVDRPVVGAHTENYNDWSFGVSAIGNFQIAKPPPALIQAEGALFAWKLSLEGIRPNQRDVQIGPRKFAYAIMGHRDTKATECPGQYLYAKIPQIRSIAASLQQGWGERQRSTSLVDSKYPSIFARRTSTKQGYVIPTGGGIGFASPATATSGVAATTQTVLTPDVTGDGVADLLEVDQSGAAQLRAGTAAGTFPAVTASYASQFRGVDLLTATGDVTGDGRPDLVGRLASTGQLVLFAKNVTGDGFTRTVVADAPSLASYDRLAVTGDVNRDGHDDLLARDTDGVLWLLAGDGRGGFAAPSRISSGWGGYDSIVGYGDYSGDGVPDLVVRTASTKKTWILPGTAGGFGKPLGPYTAPSSATRIVGAAQLRGNARPDLLTRQGTALDVIANAGRFSLGKPIATGIDLSNVVQVLNVGDWDGDGHGDVVTENRSGVLYLYRGHGDGTFAKATRLATGFASVKQLAAVGDVTGDGHPDLQGQWKGEVYLWPGNGGTGLATGYVSHAAIKAGSQIGVGLWNGDGAPDSVFRRGSTLTLYPGDGPGGLTVGAQHQLSTSAAGYSWLLGSGPFDGSGHADLLARDDTGRLWALLGTESGISGRRYLGFGMGAYDLAD